MPSLSSSQICLALLASLTWGECAWGGRAVAAILITVFSPFYRVIKGPLGGHLGFFVRISQLWCLISKQCTGTSSILADNVWAIFTLGTTLADRPEFSIKSLLAKLASDFQNLLAKPKILWPLASGQCLNSGLTGTCKYNILNWVICDIIIKYQYIINSLWLSLV